MDSSKYNVKVTRDSFVGCFLFANLKISYVVSELTLWIWNEIKSTALNLTWTDLKLITFMKITNKSLSLKIKKPELID